MMINYFKALSVKCLSSVMKRNTGYYKEKVGF